MAVEVTLNQKFKNAVYYLKGLRKISGQEQLAKELIIKQSTVSKIINGTQQLSKQLAKEFEAVYSLKLDDFADVPIIKTPALKTGDFQKDVNSYLVTIHQQNEELLDFCRSFDKRLKALEKIVRKKESD